MANLDYAKLLASEWAASDEVQALVIGAARFCDQTGYFPLDIETKLEAIRTDVLDTAWSYCGEGYQFYFEQQVEPSAPTVEDLLSTALEALIPMGVAA